MFLSPTGVNPTMTQQNVVPAEDVAAFTVAAAGSSPLFPYPPPIALRKKYLSQIDVVGVGTSCWLESMKASSPTHPMAAPCPIVDSVLEVKMRHPSALNQFDRIVRASKGKQIVMFMDYDGTLSPIVDDPDSAFMSNAMRKAVKEVARDFPTAIVSGRCLDKVVNFVKLAELYYAGSHGMDIKGPETSQHAKARVAKGVLLQPATEFLPMIDTVYKALLDRTKSTPGARVENNKFCVSVHFRSVDEKNWGALIEQVRYVLKEYPRLRLTQGRKVLEIRPTIKWDKGKALEFLLESLGFANCKDVMPIYIGDDRTDEDAFKVLRDRGQGIGILVSKFPKETNATYYLQEPSEVKDFLIQLVEWKRLSMKVLSKV
ncbi:probable trehalose-phosphate phosphatase 6 [Zingiber officinale]|uniref:probable trehalose-phosphate phosphatase 6 n=1 Tax=Zingiber officinale TaxID=94328 RepID=UPI001C4B9E63|nr:probable trehalose-phosphate phosphatase 6 [Zingiber officinale]